VRNIKKMSASDLESELKDLANGNESAFTIWKNELGSYPFFIADLRTLHCFAKDKQCFNSLLESVSIGLKVQLREWYERNYGISENLTQEKEMLKQAGVSAIPMNGIDTSSKNYIDRSQLVARAWNMVLHNPFSLICSRPDTGKTSLLLLMQERSYISKIISCKEGTDPYELLVSVGIDLKKRAIVGKKLDKDCIIALDDAHNIFEYTEFWEDLLKEGPTWLPKNIRIIISVTHNLLTRNISSFELASLPRISKKDLLISEEEAQQVIDLTWSHDFPIKECITLRHIIIAECNGVVGAIRKCIVNLCAYFDQRIPDESQLINYFFKSFSSGS
jgi:hypothetical protein